LSFSKSFTMIEKTNKKDNTIRIEMEEIYKHTPLKDIPWNNETPPKQLVDLVESGEIKPCKAVDLGCGAGNYSIWLAGKGFTMTGIDISPEAIKISRKNASENGVTCTFLARDLSSSGIRMKDTFDFAFDWDVLHHVYPDKRKQYVTNVSKLLNPGGIYLSVCFHEKDLQFGGIGKYRKTRIGTQLYFSSEQELKDLFKSCFEISELKIIEIRGRSGSHIANYVLMSK
jgi:2-polyprenyl-3-methyl-5-hydroxy-6-metoxy-1,4-benzoquinol methylase